MIDTNKSLEVRMKGVDTKHLIEEMILPEHKSIDYILCLGDSLIVPTELTVDKDKHIELAKCVVTNKKPKAAEAQAYMSDDKDVISFLRTLIHEPLRERTESGTASVH